MKAVEKFMIGRASTKNSSKAIRKETEVLANAKHYKGHGLIDLDFDLADSAYYIYTFVTTKRPNTY